jgi:hypothetical protein
MKDSVRECSEVRCSLDLTLKALANFSPGFALKPWDQMRLLVEGRNPEGVASKVAETQPASQPLQGCEKSLPAFSFPGFQNKPWAEISEHLRRYQRQGERLSGLTSNYQLQLQQQP